MNIHDACEQAFKRGYERAEALAREEINRKNAEIEELKREIENLESVQEITPEAKYFVDTKANKVISLLNEVIKSQEQIKAEAIKEFAERLKAELVVSQFECDGFLYDVYDVDETCDKIDQIAKEMGVNI